MGKKASNKARAWAGEFVIVNWALLMWHCKGNSERLTAHAKPYGRQVAADVRRWISWLDGYQKPPRDLGGYFLNGLL